MGKINVYVTKIVTEELIEREKMGVNRKKYINQVNVFCARQHDNMIIEQVTKRACKRLLPCKLISITPKYNFIRFSLKCKL